MVAQVAMVYKTGGCYSLEYVRRLAEGCRRGGAERVVCLSDDPAVKRYADHIPLRHGWEGWWSKLELFYLTDPTVYFDLDTVVNGTITPILRYPHRFTMLLNFSHTRRPQVVPRRGASGVLAWSGDFSYLPQQFRPALASSYRTAERWGDQGFINERLRETPEYFQDLFPKQIVSRKWDSMSARRVAKVICYHGNPRPHQTGWRI